MVRSRGIYTFQETRSFRSFVVMTPVQQSSASNVKTLNGMRRYLPCYAYRIVFTRFSPGEMRECRKWDKR